MPKILENVRDEILEKAIKILIEEGAEQLTMRHVADACGIAPGTIYNYFDSKEKLLAVVLFDDWREKYEGIERWVESAAHFDHSLQIIYTGIWEFAKENRKYWRGVGSLDNVGSYHEYLVKEVMKLVQLAFKKEDFTYDFVASGIEGHVVSASVIREEQKETIPMDDERVARGIEKLSLLSAETILLAVRHDDPALFDTLLTLLLK